MDPLTLIVIVLVVLYVAGFGYTRSPGYAGPNPGYLIHLLLVIALIIFLFRYLPALR